MEFSRQKITEGLRMIYEQKEKLLVLFIRY